MKKLSVIIPTLQKNKELLINLLNTLANDSGVDEIILIDNSLKGLNEKIEKLQIITPKENLFVNPSWNLGIKTAKDDIVALLNDDITITSNFCSKIAEKLTPDMGVAGFDVDFVEVSENIVPPPKETEIFLEEIKNRPDHWGIAMFFYKTSYFEIPDELKIYFGDDWLIFKNKQLKRKNYKISGQKIYHFSSLTSKSVSSKVFKQERNIYKKATLKWHDYIFSIEKRYEGYKIRFFGISSKLFKYKKENRCQK